MDIIISHNWLKDYLKTEAKPKKIAELLSLGGPSVEKIEKNNNDYTYHIEVTTNRVDSASIYGIAREAAAILPRFNVKTKLKEIDTSIEQRFSEKVDYLTAKVDHDLCPRFTAVLIKDVKIRKSPRMMVDRLKSVGERPINNIVDISNYIMHEIGQPVHTFDYDTIGKAKMILRRSRKGEKIKTLDNLVHELPGGDIVIEDGEGRLIDLAGIMGGQLSAVNKNTKNVLLFIQTYSPSQIRKTSMHIGKRTNAAVLFEKGLDTEKVTTGISRGIKLFTKLTDGKAEENILDLYPSPYKEKSVKVKLNFINKLLGVTLSKKEVESYLNPLGFSVTEKKGSLTVSIPSFRADDISLPEDIVEEVARIYGYQNIPSRLMSGDIPTSASQDRFKFEKMIKDFLAGWGGTETYTLSLVPKKALKGDGLKLKNPLGKETSYLRNSLQYSLVEAANENKGGEEKYHLFEMANVYIPKRASLPEEKLTMAGIFASYSFRDAKGIIEALMKKLNIKDTYKAREGDGFAPSKMAEITADKKRVGVFGILENTNYIYYELDVNTLRNLYKPYKPFAKKKKYPAQIEDVTLILPEKTRVQNVLSEINNAHKFIVKVRLLDIYKDAYTFRVWYQSPEKTLSDKEVEPIRDRLLKKLKKKIGAIQES